ncbi:MAG: sigma-54 dependent transcriptional regulator [Chitinophagaceae bacterium]|jgi:DNA-binding NtrC family response regulator|nr:sigma-54 dependent transcriptional regulator [Chitinophagaceae bacterium]
MSAPQILIIDDEEKLRSLLARIISLEGFEVQEAADIRSGQRKLQQADIDLVICDVKLPDGSGVDFTSRIKKEYPQTEIILLTAYGNIPDGIQAMKNGAFDYITKGDDQNKIIPLIHKAIEKASLARKVRSLEKRLGEQYSFSNILGRSKPIISAIAAAQRVAGTDTTVLLTGETGTGKEVFAQAIHQAGSRRHQEFVAVNCSAFSRELLENELFGHRAGAFTGATKDSKGIFEQANKGTVFLDEIGEMPLALQAKLLRVLETGEFLKVGDSKPTRVDVRIIAATNRDLPAEVQSGHFREDLYYRISVFQIHLPSLRERAADIEALGDHFLHYFSSKTNKKISGMSLSYLEALLRHAWKGNIRELKNVIERSVILTDSGPLLPGTLPPEFDHNALEKVVPGMNSAFDLTSAERLHIQKVLNYTQGNKTEAARLLNIALSTLYRKLEEYKIG